MRIFKINSAIVKGSFILLILFNAYNALNFFFHFSMARLLSVEDYRVLGILSSFIYIFSIFSESVQTVVVKYTSNENDLGKIKNIMKRTFKKSFPISISLYAIYIIICFSLSYLIKVSFSLLLFNGLLLLIFFFLPITRGVLQGRKQFKAMGFNMLIEAIVKLTLAIFLVIIFTGTTKTVYGAATAMILSILISSFLSLIPLRKIIISKEKYAEARGMYGYSKPVFTILFILMLFFNMDLFIANIVFNKELAGAYTIASILGKTIFFGTSGIAKAMFPLSSTQEKNASTEKRAKNIFLNALAIMSICIFFALLFIYLFPSIIINLFTGKNIPEAAEVVFYTAFAVSLISLTSLLLFYKLSINSTNRYYLLFIPLVIQAISLYLFSSSLKEFSLAFIASSAFFMIFSYFLLRKSSNFFKSPINKQK